MSITREPEAHDLSNTDPKAEPVRLRLPKVALSNDGPAPHVSGPEPAAGAANQLPSTTGRFRLGHRDGSRHLETRSKEEKLAERNGKKWQSRLRVAFVGLTCLSGAALLFDVLNGSGSTQPDDQIMSAEEVNEADAAVSRVATIPATTAVVSADHQTAGGNGAPPVISPTHHETVRHATSDGSMPRGAMLDGTIQFDDAVQVQPSNTHGAH